MDLIDQKLIKKLQGNLPLTENPYEALGRIIGIPKVKSSEAEELQTAGCLKRIGAILRHQKSGYSQNVGRIPGSANRLEETGNLLAQSSCQPLLRKDGYENWPYNLYAMFHSKEKREIENFIHDFAAKQALLFRYSFSWRN